VTTERSQVGQQTRYSLRDNGILVCMLTFGEPDSPMAIWKILKPSSHGTNDLYGTERYLAPAADRLRTWLAPIVGDEHAAELAQAVDADPPPTAAWHRPDPDAAGQT
jgi:glycosyltransferase A (GT-A) superfamily protein (DUF2064 family)